MDLFDRFAGNDSWHTRRLLEYASTLTEEQLDRPLPTVVELLPWRESNKTLRQLLENIIFTKEVWTAALSGTEMDMNGPPKSQRSPKAMLQRLEKTDAELHRILGNVRHRSAWDDTFVDAKALVKFSTAHPESKLSGFIIPQGPSGNRPSTASPQ